MKYLFLLSTISLLLNSCVQKKQCVNVSLELAFFVQQDTTVALTDTMVVINSYTANGQFNSPDTSFTSPVSSGAGAAAGHCQIRNSAYLCQTFTTHDWKLVTYPSGKEFYIKNIRFDSKKGVAKYDYQDFNCTNDLIFTCNNKDETLYGTRDFLDKKSGYLYLPY